MKGTRPAARPGPRGTARAPGVCAGGDTPCGALGLSGRCARAARPALSGWGSSAGRQAPSAVSRRPSGAPLPTPAAAAASSCRRPVPAWSLRTLARPALSPLREFAPTGGSRRGPPSPGRHRRLSAGDGVVVCRRLVGDDGSATPAPAGRRSPARCRARVVPLGCARPAATWSGREESSPGRAAAPFPGRGRGGGEGHCPDPLAPPVPVRASAAAWAAGRLRATAGFVGSRASLALPPLVLARA